MNENKLNALTRALAGLKIVDVVRKPKLLADALRKGQQLANDRASVEALQRRGFYPDIVDGKVNIFSDQGEVTAALDSGVEYVLRFGETAGLGEEDVAKPDAKTPKEQQSDKQDKKPAQAKKKKVGLNRYIYVSAQFNADLISKPKDEPLPKLADYLPKANKPAEPHKDETKKANEAKEADEVKKKDAPKKEDAEAKKAEKKDPAPKDEAPSEPKKEAKPEATKDGDSAQLPTTANTALLTDSDGDNQSPVTEAGNQEAAKPAAEQAKKRASTDKRAEPAKEADKTVERGKPDTAKPAQPKPKSPEDLAKAQFEKELARVKKENEQKRTEYDQKVKKGRELVEHLNERFADWFYVIPESEYDKIHLTAADLIQQKGANNANSNPGGLPPGHPPTGFQFPGAGLHGVPGGQ